MNKKILFVTHAKTQCGVYEFGEKIISVLKNSKRYEFIWIECTSLIELHKAIAINKPDCIIYNHQPAVFPWLNTKIVPKVRINTIVSIPILQIGIIHEISQDVADKATNYRKRFLINAFLRLRNSLFDYYIAPDPTLVLYNPILYKTGRLIPFYENNYPTPLIPTIGSFGFGYRGKGFEKIVQLVQQEFDEAIIRFNIPSGEFVDKDGTYARSIAESCSAMISKPGIQLIVSHDFLDNKALLDFLAQNTINVFLYEDKSDRGVSSVLDIAMAVGRPIAVSDSIMFRHVLDVEPSICITKSSLRAIIQNGFSPLQKHYNEWNAENMIWDYERILDAIFDKQQNFTTPKMGFIRTLQTKWHRFLSKPDNSFSWLRSSSKMTDDDLSVEKTINYNPVNIPSSVSLNRILDNEARELYKPAIQFITKLVPKTISKKIPEANVQQAFVFDTVFRLSSNYTNPKLLCVGSNEDTASMSLMKIGYSVDEIDPVMNYTLQEYFTKPSTVKNSYDIVFSTSVIEHDPDDESFVKCIAELLTPGGLAVLTCDFKEGWTSKDPLPSCDFRFYTQDDFKNRLLPSMKNCTLIDEPQWDCPNPDFSLGGQYQYTFATLVIKKSL